MPSRKEYEEAMIILTQVPEYLEYWSEGDLVKVLLKNLQIVNAYVTQLELEAARESRSFESDKNAQNRRTLH